MSHIPLIPSAYCSAWHIIQDTQFTVENLSSGSGPTIHQLPENEQVASCLWVFLSVNVVLPQAVPGCWSNIVGVISAFPANSPMM